MKTYIDKKLELENFKLSEKYDDKFCFFIAPLDIDFEQFYRLASNQNFTSAFEFLCDQENNKRLITAYFPKIELFEVYFISNDTITPAVIFGILNEFINRK